MPQVMCVAVGHERLRITNSFGHETRIARTLEPTSELPLIRNLAEALGFNWGQAELRSQSALVVYQ